MLLKIIMYSSRARSFHRFCCCCCLFVFVVVVVVVVFVFFCFVLFCLPSTSLWGVYSETFIHRYNFPLTHAFTRLCMISSSHVLPALCLFPLVTVCAMFVFKLLTIIIKHFTGYDFSACNNVRHILYNTDVINPVVKLIVHSPVGKLV